MTQPAAVSQNPMGYKLAQFILDTLPKKVQQWAQTQPAPVKQMGVFMAKQLDCDFNGFAKCGKVLLTEPPRLAFLFLLFPATVGPRLYRAWQRGRENHDYREVWDILRRDMISITLFVWALNPIVKGMSWVMERFSGVKLSDDGKVLKYSQFNNYEITNPSVLKAIVEEGNGQALAKAVSGLSDHGFSQAKGGSADIQRPLAALKDVFQKLQLTREPQLPAHFPAEKIFDQFKGLETAAASLKNKALSAGHEEAAKIAQGLSGEFTGALKNFARARRLPGDMLSFAVVIGLIGFFPVWFNKQWNQSQYDKKKGMRKHSPAGPAALPVPLTPPLSSPGVFPPPGLGVMPPAFRAQPMGVYPMGALPFRPGNPLQGR